jgi:hypothetical protein
MLGYDWTVNVAAVRDDYVSVDEFWKYQFVHSRGGRVDPT